MLYKSALVFLGLITSYPLVAQSDDVDAFVERVMEDRLISGLQLAVIRNGEISKLKSFGHANLEHAVPVNNKTIFPLNSISKAFTGIALMSLVEEGSLDLSATISTYLEGLPDSWKDITVKQLATHTAGLPYIKDVDNEGNFLSLSVGDDEWMNILKKPVHFSPGEKFDYNQLGYSILGLIIQKVSGQEFQDYVKNSQFRTADMQSSTYGDFHKVIPGKAQSYTAYDGTYYNIYEAIPEHLFPATGINSTAEDIANWVLALRNEKILKREESFEALSKPFYLEDGSLAGFEGIVNAYGIGWPVIERKEHPAMAAIGGGRSAVFIYPEDDLAIVVLTNRRGCAPEQFVDEIAGYYIPEIKASNGFGFPAEITILQKNLQDHAPDSAIRAYEKVKSKDGDYNLPENLLNSWGYKILRSGDLQKALAVFKLNVHLYPKSANVYDSYAEALLLNGENGKAQLNYRKSLELNPENENATQQLRNIKSRQ